MARPCAAILGLVLCACAVTSVAGQGTLQERMDALEARASATESDLTATKAELAAMKARLAAVEAELATTKIQLAAAGSDLGRLNGTVTALQTASAAQQTQLNDLGVWYQDLNDNSVQCRGGSCVVPAGNNVMFSDPNGYNRWFIGVPSVNSQRLEFSWAQLTNPTTRIAFSATGDMWSLRIPSLINELFSNVVRFGITVNLCHYNGRGCVQAADAWDARTSNNPLGDWEKWRINRRA
jgi:hypothetical protein